MSLLLSSTIVHQIIGTFLDELERMTNNMNEWILRFFFQIFKRARTEKESGVGGLKHLAIIAPQIDGNQPVAVEVTF